MKQYTTKNVKPGWKECLFCGNTTPAEVPCKCSVRIKIVGDSLNAYTMFELLSNQFEIIDFDGVDFEGVRPIFTEDKRSKDYYIWVAIRPPTRLQLPDWLKID